ncbi:MAG: hypothetical protein AB7E36_00835, partial [Salinivirgaceae bacterium]
MKIILSRKGFDSSYGGQASPILPDGTLLSLPIPYNNIQPTRFTDILYKGQSYFEIIRQLKDNKQINEQTFCHLDPDIRKDTVKRDSGWNGLFGQSGGAQTHLENKGIGENALFLFFGWFKKTEEKYGKLKYVRNAPDLHVIRS